MDTRKLLKYLNCELSSQETEEVQAYLANDPDGSHFAKYKDARIIFEGITLHSDAKAPVQKKHVFRKITRYAVAAAAVVLLIIGAFKWSSTNTIEDLSLTSWTINIPAEQSLQLTLSDGTKMWLGANTTVDIPQVFSSDSRNIELIEGEIYLEVEKDQNRPFFVDTYASKIKVLGTRFSVISAPDHSYFSTTLHEGSVNVISKASSSIDYTLKPSETITCNNQEWRIETTNSNINDAPLWTKGIIDITNISFQELMYKFERIYGVEIIIELKKLPELHYTMGKIRIKDGITHAMDMLKLSCNIDYSYDETNNLIYIK